MAKNLALALIGRKGARETELVGTAIGACGAGAKCIFGPIVRKVEVIPATGVSVIMLGILIIMLLVMCTMMHTMTDCAANSTPGNMVNVAHLGPTVRQYPMVHMTPKVFGVTTNLQHHVGMQSSDGCPIQPPAPPALRGC